MQADTQKRMIEHFRADLAMMMGDSSSDNLKAYYGTRLMVLEWLEEQGKKQSKNKPTKKGNALYYYRQALKYGDLKAAEQYLRRYYELGGIPELLKRTMKRVHPLTGISKEKRLQFRESLDLKDQDIVKQAIDWYRKINEAYYEKIINFGYDHFGYFFVQHSFCAFCRTYTENCGSRRYFYRSCLYQSWGKSKYFHSATRQFGNDDLLLSSVYGG
jgi:hypothetical protein